MYLYIYLLVRIKSNFDGEVNFGLWWVINFNGILVILILSVCNWFFFIGYIYVILVVFDILNEVGLIFFGF